MKKKIKIIISADDLSRLLARILIVFNRRNLLLESIKVYKIKESDIFKYIICLKCLNNQISNLIKQIEKLIGVIEVFYVLYQ